MLENKLKLNDDKIEVLLCGPSSLQMVVLIEHIQVGESQISLSASVKDFGLVIDANLDMTAHISSVVKSYCHLRSLGKLQPFLPSFTLFSGFLLNKELNTNCLTFPSNL